MADIKIYGRLVSGTASGELAKADEVSIEAIEGIEADNVQDAIAEVAANAGTGTVTSVTMNGSTITPQDGVIALGTLITSHQSLASVFGKVAYDSTTKRINFYNKDATIGTDEPIGYIDATAFIKDGMVSNVEITNGNLVVTFNTDSGKEPISIALTNIFNPSNYYTKTDIDNKGYLTTETDPSVPSWAKAQNKPSYTASEVGAVPTNRKVNNKSLSDDITLTASDVGAVSSTGFVATDNNYTTAEKTKLAGIAAGAEVNVQPNWTQTNTSADDYINNKPTLATVATSGSYNDLSNKPTIPAAQVQSDWNATSGMGVILNKPSIPDTSTLATKTELNGKQDTINDLASIRINSGKGVADMSSNADGTVVYTLANGDTYTLDLNHEHPQYLDVDDIDDYVTAGSNVTITKDSQTGVLTISASGGSSGVTDVTMNGSSVVSNGVAQLGTVLTSQTKANWTETNSSSDAYIQNKPTLATVATSGAYSDLSGAPTIPSAAGSNDTPVMDGTAAVGSSSAYAKADHVHPSDTSKANTSEMAVSTSGDQTTITLKTGTSATVINQHQSLSGYAKYVLLADDAAYEALATKDSSTLYLIPES